MSKRWAMAGAQVLLLGMTAAPVMAVPAFARRYEVACHFCHDGFPKLNTMGQRFKERGFRLEREDTFDFDKWTRTIPADLRLSASQLIIENSKDGRFAFFKPVSAGNLGTRLAYWIDWGIIVRSDSLTPSGEENVDTQPVDNAWLRLEIATGGRLYLKGGRLELDLPFTQARTPNLFSYEIYGTNTGAEHDSISDRQEGAELGGDLPASVHWSAAVVRGATSDAVNALGVDETKKFEGNVFLRLAKRSGRDRVGAFAYIGRNHLAQPGIPLSSNWKDDILRLGGDASFWVQRLNLYGVGMYGRNTNSIATPARPQGTDQELHFSGGFAQADYHLRDAVALTARLNVVSRPTSARGDNATFTSFYPGLRVYLRDRFRVAFEYGFNNRNRSGIGAVQADLAF
jgi:hypothetical protein